jgi:Phosphotransferase enzyme family
VVSGLPEIALPAGHLSLGVVRVGETVRRPAKASSAFVSELLKLLERRGVAWAPRCFGQDELGRDVLSFLPGWVPAKWRTFSDEQVGAAARLLRELHEATRGSELSGSHEIVCHHDPGPNNAVFDDADLPYSFIDFDMAAPGSVLEDVGYLAWSWCVASKPERKSVTSQASQVRLVADSYGLDCAARAGLFDALLERQTRNTRFWNEQLSHADAIASTPEKVRELIAWSEREFAFTVANRAHFEASLR